MQMMASMKLGALDLCILTMKGKAGICAYLFTNTISFLADITADTRLHDSFHNAAFKCPTKDGKRYTW